MIVLRTGSVGQTREVAAGLAALAEPGDLLLLTGDLGAGKTAFAQGFGAALGVSESITSPTFTLHRRYQGRRLRLEHLDVYRLEQLAEVADLDLPDLLSGESVTLVEWGDRILPALPDDRLEVRLSLGDDDDERTVELLPVGPRWAARAEALAGGVARWRVPCPPARAAPRRAGQPDDLGERAAAC